MTAFAHCARRVAWVFAVILFLAATSGISSAQPACTNCMGLNLTGSALVTADMTPTPDLTIPASTGVGYVTTVFSGSTSPTLPNTTYPTWCVTSHDQAVQATGSYSASSSYSAATLTSNGINYILNHKQGMVLDVQYAIWVVSGDVSLADISFAPDAVAMATAALSPAGQSFVPAPGQTMGVQLSLVPANPGVQTFFIEIKNPCGLLGDFVWNDTNNNGIQETGEQGISGVTVQLQDAGGNILATTVTGAAPAGYTPAYPTGYYQFSGLCLSTYKIVIDYSQAALTGFVPSPTLAGGDRTVDSNLNGAGTVLTTAAPIDETLDFGFSAPPVTLQCAAATTASEVGVPFNVPALTVSGGIGPYTFSVVGTLPAGLSLNTATGAITGTPTASGSFSIKVVDSKGSAATGSCPFTIVAGPSLLCVAATTASEVGVPFNVPAMTVTGGSGTYTFSVVGTLPAGLSLNATTGAITGTPTTSGSFSIKVVDSNGSVAAGTCPFTIVAGPSLVCSGATSGTVGTAFSSPALAVSGGTTPYTYSVLAGDTFPAGLALNAATGAVTGTPTAAGTFHIQVTDANGAVAAGSCPYTVVINTTPPPTVTCAPITSGRQGAPYSSSAVATGGTAPYTFSIIAGTLPAGLTLNASSGLISGTPTVFGVFSYKIQVKDSTGATANTGTSSCTLTIVPLPPVLQCGSCSSNKATVGVAYSAKLTVTGGSGSGYTFKLDTGSVLPAGLTLNSSTGVISGIPTTPGTYIVTSVVTDSMGGTDNVSCTIIVSGPPLNLSCGTCGNDRATVGTLYSSTLSVIGGKPGYTFSIIAGSLPAGLTLNPTTGVISGTPTATGNFSFTTKVVDANGISDTAQCALFVVGSPVNLDCGSCGSSKATVGVTYTSKLTVSGGKAAYTFSILSGSLPPGMTLNTTTGTISGSPTTSGTYTFTSKVVDANGNTDTATCTIVVGGGAPLNLDCGVCGTSSGKVGTAFSATFALSGGKAPFTYSITSGSLPAGLTLNSSTGVISGTPTTAGTFTFTTKVTDAAGSTDTATCTIVVTGSAINLDCGACKSGKPTLGQSYSNYLSVTGANGSVTFSISSGSLPTGLTLDRYTGKISGTPTAAGTYTFTSKVMDSRGNTDTDICTLTVSSVPLDIQCGSCSVGNGTTGTAYSATFAVTGGVPGYTFSIISGSLPAGLTLNASTGVISGTPTSSGTYSFTAKVTDSRGTTDTVTCSIAIAAVALDIQCGTCGNNRATAGTAYSSTLAATGGSGSYTYSIASGSLPAGVTLNSSTGAISGTPTTGGTYTFTSKVTDSKGKTDTVSCTLTVVVSPVDLECGSCGGNKAQAGSAYSSTLKATGGTGPYTYSIVTGSLPAGVSLNPTTGVISGTPTTDGTYSFTSKATDSKGNTDTASCSIVVLGSIQTGDYVTYTQGGWGASPSGNNPGTLLKNNFSKVYPGGSVVIGGTKKLTFTSATAIASFLPQGGTPGVFGASATNPTSSAAGEFAGQVLALQLSVDFSNKGITPGGLANLKLNSGALSGQTIAQVLALANSVIGGGSLPSGLTLSGLNDIVNTINNNFDGGTTNGGCAH